MRPLLLLISAMAFAQTTPPTPAPGTGEWGFAVVGDPQYNTCAATPTASIADCTNWVSPSTAQAAVWPNQISHIISQQSTRNLQFVLFVGDLTDQATQIVWDVVSASLQQLKTAGIPVLSMPGNHDNFTGTGIPGYNNMMASLYSGATYIYGHYGRTTFGGAESVGAGWQNTAYSLTINNRPLLVLCVEYNASDAALDWAKGVEATWIAANPRGRVWFATHDFGSSNAHIPLIIDDSVSWPAHVNTYWLASDPYIETVFCGHWNMGFAAKSQLGPWTVVEHDTQNSGFGAGGDVGYYRVKQNGTIDGCVWMAGTSTWAGTFFSSWPANGCVTYTVQPWRRPLFPMPGGLDR